MEDFALDTFTDLGKRVPVHEEGEGADRRIGPANRTGVIDKLVIDKRRPA